MQIELMPGMDPRSPSNVRSTHTPIPDPQEDEEEPDVKQPPVPPDQEPDIVPQREPPNPDETHPLIAAEAGLRLVPLKRMQAPV